VQVGGQTRRIAAVRGHGRSARTCSPVATSR
jgi:hypothetical protein